MLRMLKALQDIDLLYDVTVIAAEKGSQFVPIDIGPRFLVDQLK